MDHCKHINKITPGRDHSILNPQKWMCFQCGTTESVWACMSCPNVSCGRYNEEHALKHFHETKHPLAIEVNDKYVFCYECDDYILNDNAAGDLKILRSALSAIATHSFSDLEAKSRRILRSHSLPAGGIRWEEKLLRYQDLSQTAVKFRRHYQLAKAFTNWKLFVLWEKDKSKPQNDTVSSQQPGAHEVVVLPSKKAIIPGVAGLRNLGNTCYMNSILQVLSHLKPFRDYFLNLKPVNYAETGATTSRTSQNLRRQTTIDCFKYLAEGESSATLGSPNQRRGGLNGGGHSKSSSPLVSGKCDTRQSVRTLCEELHYLLRVLWSGKWALVSPHKMLSAVWQLIPFFKGFAQQDAQEFLSELLDKVDSELRRMFNLNFIQATMIDDLFQGKLVSEVRCCKCGTTSQTSEPFCDLSLEFPVKYHTHSATQGKCHLQEMLTKFTEAENLGPIYACEKCQENQRRSSRGSNVVHTDATKQLQIQGLPRILRLHLKRFMWSGRNHRGKISTHVEFPEKLDLSPFCHREVDTKFSLYQLSAVVIHHGRGFGSGHYTAYCHSEEAGSWVHCNDSRVEMSSLKDVMTSQVYILFYTKIRQKIDKILDANVSFRSVDSNESFDEAVESDADETITEEVDEEISFNFKNQTSSKLPPSSKQLPPSSKLPKFMEMKRRLSCNERVPVRIAKRRKSNLW